MFSGTADSCPAQDGRGSAAPADSAEENKPGQKAAVHLLLPALHCHSPGGTGTTNAGQEEPVGPGEQWSCPFSTSNRYCTAG